MKELFFYYLENYQIETVFACFGIGLCVSIIIVAIQNRIKNFFKRKFH